MFRNTTLTPTTGNIITFPNSRNKARIRKSNITNLSDLNLCHLLAQCDWWLWSVWRSQCGGGTLGLGRWWPGDTLAVSSSPARYQPSLTCRMLNIQKSLFDSKFYQELQVNVSSGLAHNYLLLTLLVRTLLTTSCCSTTFSTWMTTVRTVWVTITWMERTGSTWWISKKRLAASTATRTIPSRTLRGSGNTIKVREKFLVILV